MSKERELIMPNGKAHLLAGTICGAATSIIIQTKVNKREQIDLGHALLSTGVGFAGGRLPDIIEPPLHPNHRAFFHSFVFGSILGIGVVKIWKVLKDMVAKREDLGKYRFTKTDIAFGLLFVVFIVLIIHLAMDAFTKKGLPII